MGLLYFYFYIIDQYRHLWTKQALGFLVGNRCSNFISLLIYSSLHSHFSFPFPCLYFPRLLTRPTSQSTLETETIEFQSPACLVKRETADMAMKVYQLVQPRDCSVWPRGFVPFYLQKECCQRDNKGRVFDLRQLRAFQCFSSSRFLSLGIKPVTRYGLFVNFQNIYLKLHFRMILNY